MGIAIGIVAPGIDAHLLLAAAQSADYDPTTLDGLDCASVDAIVVHAFTEDPAAWLTAARTVSCPSVLCCAPSADAPIPSQGHTEPSCTERVLSLTADAYVWRERLLTRALAHVLSEDRTRRTEGPLRLVFLGHGGADHTRSFAAPEIGESFELAEAPVLIGRATQSKVAIKFSTSVARHHARVRRESGDVVVDDLGSTNGTFVRGEQIHGPTSVQVGDEIAIAGFLRLRLDGAHSSSTIRNPTT